MATTTRTRHAIPRRNSCCAKKKRPTTMNTPSKYPGLTKTALAAVVAAAFGPALAQETDSAQLTGPGNSISVGAGIASGTERDRARFGMFNGLRDHDINGLFGFSYNNRNAASGTWM